MLRLGDSNARSASVEIPPVLGGSQGRNWIMHAAIWKKILAATTVILIAGLVGYQTQCARALNGRAERNDKIEGRQARAKDPIDSKKPDTKVTPKAKPKAAPEPVQLKAFELAHVDAEKMRQTLSTVWPSLMSLKGSTTTTAPRLAANSRTKTLFVRGTAKELEAVEDLISILDTASGKPLPDGKWLRAIRLEHAKVPEVVTVLNGLGIQSRVIALHELNTLLVGPAEEGSSDIRLVIEKLDVAKKDEKKTDKTTKKPIDKSTKKPVRSGE
jgi:hypothetical protein